MHISLKRISKHIKGADDLHDLLDEESDDKPRPQLRRSSRSTRTSYMRIILFGRNKAKEDSIQRHNVSSLHANLCRVPRLPRYYESEDIETRPHCSLSTSIDDIQGTGQFNTTTHQLFDKHNYSSRSSISNDDTPKYGTHSGQIYSVDNWH